jgi:isopenicillin N synthase-like dioxygenase
MSSETRDFPGLPPFPKDVATAPLLCLCLQKLLAFDAYEIKRLVEACEDLGFFYLDLQNCGSTSDILDDVDKLFAISKEFFSLSLEEKKKYDFSAQNSYFGYKSQGAVVVDKNGTRDRNESYNVINHAHCSQGIR